jgi:type II secretory pathway component PulF
MLQSKLSLEDMQALSEEIRHLVQAGMPLVESLAQAGTGRGVRLTRVMQTLSDGLSQGKTLPELIERESIGAPRMLASAIGAGIQSNSLGLTVELMGDFAADIVDLRNRLLQAAAYPFTVVLIASVMLILFVQNTLSIFLDTILSWDLHINPVLLLLLKWNQAAPWWTWILPAGMIILIGFWIMSGRASTMAFQGPEKIFLLLPGVYPLIRDMQNYTLTRMLSLLADRGITLPDALTLAGGASGSARLERACHEASANIRSGDGIGPGFSTAVAPRRLRRYYLPPLLDVCLQQVQHSEDRLVLRLRSVADFYRNRLERNFAWLRLVMPFAMFVVVAGGCALFYSMMVFWPAAELYRHLGQ